MSETSFATLKEVDPRTAWLHEAHVFTPWLAANLDRLAQAIGIPLELERAEAPVGRYSADILARNPQDGAAVLIENQLEPSDHTHLGQIMTYLTGLDAKTMIWVAPSFREEHLSALRWLNEHTVDPFAFFAVKVRVVQIADSPLAPLFEVLERPNGWDRTIQTAVRETRSAGEGAVPRRAFWTQLLSRYPASAEFGPATDNPSRWRPVPGTDLVVAEYIALGGAGVHVRGVRGMSETEVLAVLEPSQIELANRLGAELPSRGGSGMFGKKLALDPRNPENWDTMIDWMETEAARYADVLAEVLGASR